MGIVNFSLYIWCRRSFTKGKNRYLCLISPTSCQIVFHKYENYSTCHSKEERSTPTTCHFLCKFFLLGHLITFFTHTCSPSTLRNHDSENQFVGDERCFSNQWKLPITRLGIFFNAQAHDCRRTFKNKTPLTFNFKIKTSDAIRCVPFTSFSNWKIIIAIVLLPLLCTFI